HFAFAVESFAHEAARLSIRVGLGRMLPPAISALDLQVVHVLDRLRVAEDVIVPAANVAAEEVAEGAAVFAHIENDLRSAEDVAGVAKSNGDAVRDGERAVVVKADE